MNTNFFWQPACIQLLPEPSNTLYFNSTYPNFVNQSYLDPAFEELKKKCEELETENTRLKQQLSLLATIHVKKNKRIVKRRREEELVKSYKCQHINCKKQYASTLALNLHIRNKHPHDIQNKDHQKNTEPLLEQQQIKQEGENSTQ